MMPDTEARRHRRAQMHGLVHCTTSSGARIVASGGNISCGGLFVPTGNAPGVGDEIHVQFRLPYPGHSLTRQAKVVWRRSPEEPPGPAGVGLAFTDLTDRDQAAIAQFVERSSAPA